LHRFDTIHECDRQTDRQTDRRPDDGKDARSILLSRVIKSSVYRHRSTCAIIASNDDNSTFVLILSVSY